MTETTRTLTPFEAFELEIWGLRNAFDRNRTVPILLDFAVRQREHSLADAVEATLQIYRRYRERYRKDAPSTSKTSMLIPEIEAYSNGLRTEDKDALVTLPGSDGGEVNYVVDSDLFREVDGAREYPWRDREPARRRTPRTSQPPGRRRSNGSRRSASPSTTTGQDAPPTGPVPSPAASGAGSRAWRRSPRSPRKRPGTRSGCMRD